jgi:hypothetical protein
MGYLKQNVKVRVEALTKLSEDKLCQGHCAFCPKNAIQIRFVNV